MTARLPQGAAPTQAAGARVPELDGIRGVAILLVLVSHWGVPATTSNWFKGALGLGWIGVDLFFVLSGFLITGLLLESKGTPGYFRRFYLRRAFRIFPIYYLYLLLYFHVFPLRMARRSGEAWYWLYLANWRVDSFGDLRHFWSLAIEEQFYMVWPLLIMLTPVRKLKYVAASCIALSPLLRLWFAYRGILPIFLYQTTPFRLEGLAFGALLAVALRDEQLRIRLKQWFTFAWPVAAAAMACIVITSGTSALTRPMSVAGFLCAGILWATWVFRTVVSGSGSPPTRRLRSPWLMNFGKYSYGLYVWHFPIARRAAIMTAGILSHTRGWRHYAILPASLVGGIAVSYAAALISWTLVERPFARVRDKLSGRADHKFAVTPQRPA